MAIEDVLSKIVENENEIKQMLLKQCKTETSGDEEETIVKYDMDEWLDPPQLYELVDDIVSYYTDELNDEEKKEVKVIYTRSVAGMKRESILKVNKCLSKKDIEHIINLIHDEFNDLIDKLCKAIILTYPGRKSITVDVRRYGVYVDVKEY